MIIFGKSEITPKLVYDCIAFDKAEYNEDKTYKQVLKELQDLERRNCRVSHILNCKECPAFGKHCPIHSRVS